MSGKKDFGEAVGDVVKGVGKVAGKIVDGVLDMAANDANQPKTKTTLQDAAHDRNQRMGNKAPGDNPYT